MRSGRLGRIEDTSPCRFHITDVSGDKHEVVDDRGRGEEAVNRGQRVRHVQRTPPVRDLGVDRQDSLGEAINDPAEPVLDRQRGRNVASPQVLDPRPTAAA